MNKNNLITQPKQTTQVELEQQLWAAESEIRNLVNLINKLPLEQARHLNEVFARITKWEPKSE
jgi:hypothetical protein